MSVIEIFSITFKLDNEAFDLSIYFHKGQQHQSLHFLVK